MSLESKIEKLTLAIESLTIAMTAGSISTITAGETVSGLIGAGGVNTNAAMNADAIMQNKWSG